MSRHWTDFGTASYAKHVLEKAARADCPAHGRLRGICSSVHLPDQRALVEKNSYIPETKRYYVLFDDAMVSMRYAKNLANGYGLVWNPGGPRVEGFTNPLWVGYMTIYHLLDIDQFKTSLYIQVTGALLLANLVVVKRIAERVQRKRIKMISGLC